MIARIIEIVKLANSVFSTAEFANTEEKLQFCKKKFNVLNSLILSLRLEKVKLHFYLVVVGEPVFSIHCFLSFWQKPHYRLTNASETSYFVV
jgi:hypothetical protein